MSDKLTAGECLTQLCEMYSDQFCRVMEFTEFFPVRDDKPEETAYSTMIQIGFPRGARFEGHTLEEAMAQVPIPYEDQTCGECRYGAIDYSGLCVIDAQHKAVVTQ